MSSEQFANRPSSTVAVAYTATDLTLEVADASDFPATGTFRVSLGNTEQTIFRVDSVSGNVFTGAAEDFDGDAAIGATVKIVASKGAAERFVQTPSAGEIHAYGGAAGVDRYGPIWKLTPLDQSAWSWVNQDDAAVVQTSGVVRLTTGALNNEIHARVVAAPSTPYVITANVIPHLGIANSVFGITFYESGTGKLVQMAVRIPASSQNGLFSARRENSVSSHASQVESAQFMAFGALFLRIADNGTSTALGYSMDGVHFTTLIDEARGAFFTTGPDQVGIFLQQFGGAMGMSVISWDVA